MTNYYHTAAYPNKWPDYPELLYGHELAPNPGLRPFAPFRLYKTPVAPPYHKTKAEVEYTAGQQAWSERQLRLYATGPPRASGAASVGPTSAVAVDEATRIRPSPTPSAWAAWSRVLGSAEPLWHTGHKGIETAVAWVACMVNAAAARMRGAYESCFVAVSVGAILLALVGIAEGLLRLVGGYVHPGDSLAEEPHYILVREVKIWAIPQPPNCA